MTRPVVSWCCRNLFPRSSTESRWIWIWQRILAPTWRKFQGGDRLYLKDPCYTVPRVEEGIAKLFREKMRRTTTVTCQNVQMVAETFQSKSYSDRNRNSEAHGLTQPLLNSCYLLRVPWLYQHMSHGLIEWHIIYCSIVGRGPVRSDVRIQ